MKLLQKMKVGVYASFIVGPQFTKIDFQRLKEVKRLRIRQAYFSILTPLPDTELFERVKEPIRSGH